MGLPPNGASPQYPATPASTSPYSPYNFFNTHSRSNSNSNSNPRSTSPALSVASALTSVSSSTGPSKGQNQINPAPVVRKHKKQRLFNVDRKEICLYHKENPTARQEDIAIKYGVERSTISKILKHKQKWMNVPTEEEFKVAKHRYFPSSYQPRYHPTLIFPNSDPPNSQRSRVNSLIGYPPRRSPKISRFLIR